LKRIPVQADGNCFLSAVVKYLSENENDIDVAALRRILVEYMRSEKIHYKNVVAFDKEMTEEEKDIKFEHLLQDLSVDGHWNMKLTDFMPLANTHIFKYGFQFSLRHLTRFTRC
jgi:hypothetical protein